MGNGRVGVDAARRPPFWRRTEVRFLGTFVVLFVALYALAWGGISAIVEHVFDPWVAGEASRTAWLLRRLGGDVVAEGAVVGGRVLGDAPFSMVIEHGCEAIDPLIILVAGVLAFPASWRDRGLGLLVGIALIVGLNVVRLAVLFLVGEAFSHETFDLVHRQVASSVMVVLSAAIWLLWARWTRSPRRKR